MSAEDYGSFIRTAPQPGMANVDGDTLVGVVESDVNLVAAETLPLVTQWARLSAAERERAFDALNALEAVIKSRRRDLLQASRDLGLQI